MAGDPSHVGAVPVLVVPARTRGKVHVAHQLGGEVLMVLVDATIEDGDDHARRAGGDRPRLRRVDIGVGRACPPVVLLPVIIQPPLLDKVGIVGIAYSIGEVIWLGIDHMRAGGVAGCAPFLHTFRHSHHLDANGRYGVDRDASPEAMHRRPLRGACRGVELDQDPSSSKGCAARRSAPGRSHREQKGQRCGCREGRLQYGLNNPFQLHLSAPPSAGETGRLTWQSGTG